MKPTQFNQVPETNRSAIQQMRPAPDEIAAQYTDAELYRIICAQALTNGAFLTKGEFDAHVRTLGNINGADELIAMRNKRPGCRAWRHGRSFVCECGTTWRADDTNPPACKME
jgi:hypothetical protein